MFKTIFMALLLQFGGDCPMVDVVERFSIDVDISSQEQYYGGKLKWKI